MTIREFLATVTVEQIGLSILALMVGVFVGTCILGGLVWLYLHFTD